MKSISALANGLILIASTVGIGPASGGTLAQESGEERCSPDGYVMTYEKRSYGGRWSKSVFRRCDAGGNGSRDDDEDQDDRPATRGQRGSARPEDGDRKCVAHEILQYERNEFVPANQGWKRTFQSC